MAEATVLGQGSIQVADGTVTVVRYDRVSVDHVYQNLWKVGVRAAKARTTDYTDPVDEQIRRHVVLAER